MIVPARANRLANRQNLGRIIQTVLRPRRVDRLRKLRSQDTDSDYSFKPFDLTRSIFVHIPKAAGVSVCHALYGGLAGGHTTIRDYQLAFSRAEFDGYFKFTFVRNPWSRLFSAYNFLKAGGMGSLDLEWSGRYLCRYSNFEHFVMEGLGRPEVSNYTHFIPQTAFLRSFGPDNYPINFVGFFERVERDFDLICSKLNLNATFSHQNKTHGKAVDYRLAYTDQMKNKVQNVYALDIKLLGYDFEGAGLPRQVETRERRGLLVAS